MFIKSEDGKNHVDVDAITLIEKREHKNYENLFFVVVYMAYPSRSIEILKEVCEKEADDLISKIWQLKDRSE
jgi:hypothetical protein